MKLLQWIVAAALLAAPATMSAGTYATGHNAISTAAGDNGTAPVWYGMTELDGFSAEYSITYNEDQTLTVGAYFETEKEVTADNRNFHIYIGGDEWLKLMDDGTGLHIGTTVSTFEEGSEITWEWYLPYAGGVYQEANSYTIGSSNEAPLSVRIKASVQNVTFNSAEIAYSVTCPEGADCTVFYKAADGDAVQAVENPIRLIDLEERTQYLYEVYAVANDIESRHVEVSFLTPSENAVDYLFDDLYAAQFNNAYLIGEDESMRRTIYANIPWSIVYHEDGTAVYSADLSQAADIVGLNPQIWWNGFQQLIKNADTGRYEYTFKNQELGAETGISHYFAYNGGVIDVRTPYTSWGMEKEAPVVGEVANFNLSASMASAIVGETVILSAVATDMAGYYLPVDDIEFIDNFSDDEVNGSAVTIRGAKGIRTISATYGDLKTSTEIVVLASAEARNRASGLIGVTDVKNIQAGIVEYVTDDNLTSQLEWRCENGDASINANHYFIIDLANGEESHEGYYIEAVDVLFEGAYATHFTVTLSSAAPEELSNGVSTYAAATDDVVFENTKSDTQHYFTQDPTASHRYVTLRTTEALNNTWGIKLRDLKVYATDAKPSSETTGVEDIAVDNSDEDAPVEYYNLNGVRVAHPSAGLYIRRQGNNVSKIVIK